MKENAVLVKSENFAIRIIRLYQYLQNEKKEFVLSKQLLRSGTSIGANIREGVVAMSKNEFKAKLNISYKESNETQYWLELLVETDYLTRKEFNNLNADCSELIKLLTSIIKTTNKNNL